MLWSASTLIGYLFCCERLATITDKISSHLNDAAIQELANTPGPQSFVNWKLCAAGAPRTGIEEVEFYTDTRITGEYETGPLKFINTIAHDLRRIELRPAIVLRFSYYLPTQRYRQMDDTIDDHYHAGDNFDEIAALTSLFLGIRVQAGPETREFYPGRDPLGTPRKLSMKPIPALYPVYNNHMVPRLSEPADLVGLNKMEKLVELMPEEASVVVKAARSYQAALWFADSHPEMSWLFLVSSIESAASHLAKKCFVYDHEFLPDEINKILTEHNCHESVKAPLSGYFKNTTKSTQKFVGFLLNFVPDPPEARPESESLRVNFNAGELKIDFKYIYKRRSLALHEGIPFPMPMCLPRRQELKEEREFSLGMSARGATWNFKKYKPIRFHVFEHIVRGALINWLNSLGAN